MPKDLNSQVVGDALGTIFSEYVCVPEGGVVVVSRGSLFLRVFYTFSPMVMVTVTQRSRIDLQVGALTKQKGNSSPT